LTSAARLACRRCYLPDDTPRTWLSSRAYSVKAWGIAAVIAVAVATAGGLAAGLFAPVVGVRLAEDGAVRETAYATYFILQLVAPLLLVPAGVLVLVWMWRSAKNLEAFPRLYGDLGAGWAIGGWFIPIANLFFPYRVMSQIVREELTARWEALVGLWWACWVLSFLGSLAGSFLGVGQGTPLPADLDPMGAHVEFFQSRALSGYASALLVGVGGICLSILILAASRSQARRTAARAERLAKAAAVSAEAITAERLPRQALPA
jgi:hypothetical protein